MAARVFKFNQNGKPQELRVSYPRRWEEVQLYLDNQFVAKVEDEVRLQSGQILTFKLPDASVVSLRLASDGQKSGLDASLNGQLSPASFSAPNYPVLVGCILAMLSGLFSVLTSFNALDLAGGSGTSDGSALQAWVGFGVGGLVVVLGLAVLFNRDYRLMAGLVGLYGLDLGLNLLGFVQSAADRSSLNLGGLAELLLRLALLVLLVYDFRLLYAKREVPDRELEAKLTGPDQP